jgi:hypothetical protein
MSVLVQSGSIVDIDESQIIDTPEIQNAGTYQNAGTVNQSKSNVASGAGLGIGEAIERPNTKSVATGFGDGFGNAAVITADYIRSGTTINTPRVISWNSDKCR